MVIETKQGSSPKTALVNAIKKLKGLISIVMNDDKIEKILTVK